MLCKLGLESFIVTSVVPMHTLRRIVLKDSIFKVNVNKLVLIEPINPIRLR